MKRSLTLSLLAIGALVSCPLAQGDVIELGQLLSHAKKEERRRAARELGQQGPEAALVIRQLTRALSDEDDQVWFLATSAIADIGPKAKHAIPRLVKELSGGDVRYSETRSRHTAYALGQIGPAAIPALTKALADDNEQRRWGAIHALGLIGPAAESSVPVILTMLDDDAEIVRREAIETASHFPEITIEQTGALLQSSSPLVRQGAAEILRKLAAHEGAQKQGLHVRSALLAESDPDTQATLVHSAATLGVDPEFLAPFLMDALLGNEAQQEAVFQASISLEPIRKEFLPKLCLLLAHADTTVRQRSATLLGRLSSDAVAASPNVIQRLTDADTSPKETETLLQTLVLTGPNALPHILRAVESVPPADLTEAHWAITALTDLAPISLAEMERSLPKASPPVACALLHALPRYTQRHRPVEKPVLAWLAAEEPALRASAMTMLCRLPIPDKLWLRSHRQALTDKHPFVRIAAIKALAQAPLSSKRQLKVLMASLEDDDALVRQQVVQAMGQLEDDAADAVPALLASVQGPSPTEGYRAEIIRTFGRIGGAAASATQFLSSHLHDEASSDTRLACLSSLGAIGRKAEEALPKIHALTEAKDPTTRRAAIECFAKVSDKPKDMITVFTQALDAPEDEVRHAAIASLGSLREDAAPAAEQLIALLDNETDRRPAYEALREVRITDVDLCLRLLESKNSAGRLLACERLGRIGEKRALPALRKALKDRERYVRRRAEEAIKRIEREHKKG